MIAEEIVDDTSSVQIIKFDPDGFYPLKDVCELLGTYPYIMRDKFRRLDLPMAHDAPNTYVKGEHLLTYLRSIMTVIPKRSYTRKGSS